MADVTGRVIATDLGFTEGPVIRQRGEFVVVSCDRGRLYRIADGVSTVFAATGGGPNGAVEGPDERIYVAQNGRGVPPYGERVRGLTGGVQVIAADGGEVEWVTQDPVSPNDLCFGPDGLLYVTDPTRPMARHQGRLWAVDVTTGDTEILKQLDWYTNGIGFGLDPSIVYVADSSNGRVVRFSIDNGKLGDADPFIQVEKGFPDGFDFDTEGNLILSIPGAATIETWSPEGKQLDVTHVGDGEHGFTNVAITDHTLIGCDARHGTVVQYDDWPATGLPLCPFRK